MTGPKNRGALHDLLARHVQKALEKGDSPERAAEVALSRAREAGLNVPGRLSDAAGAEASDAFVLRVAHLLEQGKPADEAVDAALGATEYRGEGAGGASSTAGVGFSRERA